MVEALSACEPDMLQVSNISHTLDTDQRVLGQLSDLYDRELVGIIGNYLPPNNTLLTSASFDFYCSIFCLLQVGQNRSQDLVV